MPAVSVRVFQRFELEDQMSISKEELERILDAPTASISDAGRAIGSGKNGAYAAVARGEIPVIKLGDRARVPTAWIRKALMLDLES